MKGKQIVKIVVDGVMTLGLLAVMGYQLWGDAAHEWVGAGLFVLFILHHLLNLGWWKSLFRGKYTPLRGVTVAVDILLLLAMLGQLVSGVILSQHVFTFLPIRGGAAFARLLHMVAGHWGFLLMAVHLGLHWVIFLGLGRRAARLTAPSAARSVVLNCVAAVIAVYGVVAFLRRDVPTYLFLQSQFVFLDFEEPKLLFYLDYLAIMGLFVFLGHWGARALKGRKKA